MEWDSTLLDEDDSLLQPTPTRIANCSSPSKYSRNPEDLIKDNCSSSKDTSNKENISVNKCEGQKLNMEPVQMKKKKKGGGYNLRKSLAWDRSFFTEEGVLDPLELSMISGTHINSSRESLSTINEDDSLSHGCQSNIDSGDLQVLEKNLFKEVLTVSSKNNTVPLPPKHSPGHARRASTSLVAPKVLPTRGASRAGPRDISCGRPLPLSSLKRRATINASQAVTKESKLPRIPVSKPGHSSNLLNDKKATQCASTVKKKQIAQPAAIIQNQRNVAPKSSPRSIKHNQCKPKAGSGPFSVKASAAHSKTNFHQQANSLVFPHSLTQLILPAGNKVTHSGPKLIMDDVGPSIAVPLPECLDDSSQVAASLPNDTSATSSIKQHKQFPHMKPSGLRMPSPSLGFFGQPKTSVSHSASQRAVEAGLMNPGYLKPPHSPVNAIEIVNDTMLSKDTAVLRSRSDSQAVSHEKIKKNVGEDAIKKDLNVSNEDKPSKPMNDKSAIYCNLDSSALGCAENRISTNSEWEKCDLLPQQNSRKCAKGVSGPRNLIENSLSCWQDLHHVSEEHGDILESSSGEAVRLTCGNEHLLGEKGFCNKDSQNHSSESLENADLENPACVKTEQKISGLSSQERCEELEKPLLKDDVTFQSHTEKTELQMKNIISTSTCKNILNHCSNVGDLDEFSRKSFDQSPYTVQYPENDHGISVTNCEVVEKASEEYMQEVADTLPGTILDVMAKSENDSSDEISEVPVILDNDSTDKRKIVGDALAKDSGRSLVEITSSVENHNYSVSRSVCSDVIGSSGITFSDSHSALNEASKSLTTNKYRIFNLNYVLDRQVNEDEIMVEDSESLTFLGACLESEIGDANYGSLLSENKMNDKDQKCNLENILPDDSTVDDSSTIPLETTNVPQVDKGRQINECLREVISSSNVPVESCTGHAQLVSNQFTAVVGSETSGEAGLSNFCILVEKVPQNNQSLIPDPCLSRERTVLAEFKENTVLERGIDATSGTINASESLLRSSIQICSTPPQVHFNSDVDNSASYAVHIKPDCVEVEPSPESCRPFAESQMKHDVKHEGLLVEDPKSSQNRDQRANILKKNTVPDEKKADSPQDVDVCTGESLSDLDASLCPAEDKDTISPIIKSQSSSSRNGAGIIVPTNAVPFSDEWLAAMEAAGEDILKMKSGAVQNSPTEKPVPKPSPWSPVRRKNNPIGPFDCTKFTNNMSTDSQ